MLFSVGDRVKLRNRHDNVYGTVREIIYLSSSFYSNSKWQQLTVELDSIHRIDSQDTGVRQYHSFDLVYVSPLELLAESSE